MIVKKISYIFFRFFISIFRIVPFWLLYIFSNFVYFLLYYVVSYRKSVVIKNLKKCFPEKTDEEIKVLSKKFYRILSDLFLETFKGFTMSKQQHLDRFRQKVNLDIDQYFDQGRDLIFMVGHCSNWEWAISSVVENTKYKVAALYKPVKNPYIDAFIKRTRARFGMDMVSIYETRKYFTQKKEKPVMYVMIADQYMPLDKKKISVDFFYSQTGFMNGAENYARMLNIPVIYTEIRQMKRGFYEYEISNLVEFPNELKPGELTQRYATMLENSIKKQPENWMWSHKRWKYELYNA